MVKEIMEKRENRIFTVTQLMNKYKRILKGHAVRASV